MNAVDQWMKTRFENRESPRPNCGRNSSSSIRSWAEARNWQGTATPSWHRTHRWKANAGRCSARRWVASSDAAGTQPTAPEIPTRKRMTVAYPHRGCSGNSANLRQRSSRRIERTAPAPPISMAPTSKLHCPRSIFKFKYFKFNFKRINFII